MKHFTQWIRHAVQLVILLFILAMPVVSQYRHYVASNKIIDVMEQWPESLERSLLLTLDKLFRTSDSNGDGSIAWSSENNKEILDKLEGNYGNTWAAKIAGISIVDPLAGLETITTSKTVTSVILIALLIPIISTLLLGRIFCSWMCPVGFLLEVTSKLRRVLEFLGLRPRNIRFSRSNKYIVLLVGLIIAGITAVPVLGFFYLPAVFVREAQAFVYSLFGQAEQDVFGFTLSGLTFASLFLLLLVFAEIFISERLWCRYFCPGGALYSLIGVKRVARIRRVKSRCTDCGDCTKACPMGLNPMKDSTGIECDNCLACTSACDSDALTSCISRTSLPIIDSPPSGGTLGRAS